MIRHPRRDREERLGFLGSWDEARTSPPEAPSVLPAATQWYRSSVVHAFLIKIDLMDQFPRPPAARGQEYIARGSPARRRPIKRFP